jgi:tetratricopeptide (TPR) repeat protein
LTLAVIAAGVYRQSVSRHQLLCKGAERKLAGIWDDEHRRSIQTAFGATQLAYAQTTFAKVSESLGAYANAWVQTQTEACEATRLHGEQSEEMLDRRTSCLEQRREELRALVQQFEDADAAMIARAAEAVDSLTPLSRCADLEVLRLSVPLPREPSLRAAVHEQQRTLIQVKELIDSGRYNQAVELAQTVASSSHSRAFPPLGAEAHYYLGDAQFRAGQFPAAQSSLVEAVMLSEAGRDDRTLALAAIRLVRVVGVELGKFDEAQFWERFARSAIARVPSSDELLIQLLRAVGMISIKKGQYEQALSSLNEALRSGERSLGPEHSQMAFTLNEIGNASLQLGQLDEAEHAYRSAQSIWEKNLGSEHPNTGVATANLALVLFTRRDLGPALEAWQRAWAIHQKALGPVHPGSVLLMLFRSKLYVESGDPALAIEYATRALKLLIGIYGPRHIRIAEAYLVRGSALAAGGQFTKALDQHQRALELGEKLLGKDHPDSADCLMALGKDWLGLHQPARAIKFLEQSIRLFELGWKESLDLADARFLLAQALWQAKGEQARAWTLALAARSAWERTGSHPEQVETINRWLDQRGRRLKEISIAD